MIWGCMICRPTPASPSGATPLDELPVVSLDTETTGLDVRRDRLLSVGAVHLHGHRLYLGETFDRLVNPAQRIPPGSTAIHSITDAMIAEAPDYASSRRRSRPLLRRARLGRP